MSDLDTSQRRLLVLGLDVSTSVTGLCLLDPAISDKSGIEIIDRIEFKGGSDLWDKADKTHERLKVLKDLYKNAKWQVALEEPLLGFQKGMSSATTITTLMRFNGIVSYISKIIFDVKPNHISAASARKLCGIKMQRTSLAGMSGKEQVFKYMSENDLNHIDWPKKKNGNPVDWSRDATDAYVIAKAHSLGVSNI